MLLHTEYKGHDIEIDTDEMTIAEEETLISFLEDALTVFQRNLLENLLECDGVTNEQIIGWLASVVSPSKLQDILPRCVKPLLEEKVKIKNEVRKEVGSITKQIQLNLMDNALLAATEAGENPLDMIMSLLARHVASENEDIAHIKNSDVMSSFEIALKEEFKL